MRTITNKQYDVLGENIESYLEEYLGVNMDASQVNDILQIICHDLDLVKGEEK
jgi:hypothetical protein